MPAGAVCDCTMPPRGERAPKRTSASTTSGYNAHDAQERPATGLLVSTRPNLGFAQMSAWDLCLAAAPGRGLPLHAKYDK